MYILAAFHTSVWIIKQFTPPPKKFSQGKNLLAARDLGLRSTMNFGGDFFALSFLKFSLSILFYTYTVFIRLNVSFD